jgi:hypothetical protein
MRTKGLNVLIVLCGLLAFAAAADAGNVIYHGGPVIVSAKVVDIFWGPSFANPASPDFVYAQNLILFRNQFGTTREYNVITQYYQIVGLLQQFIQLSNLGSGTADWFDTSTPPADVTDADVRNEIWTYLATHAFDDSTIYEVFLPATSYSSYGSSTSCGGPALAYCTYHNFIGLSSTTAIKYTVQPYASCGGCQVSGWTADQNQEHFVALSTRETVVDPRYNGWFDATGIEGAAKCAWSPPPFLDGGFGYPYEWSNAAGKCVRKM